MNLKIDERIYKWLLFLDVLKPEGRKLKNSTLIELSLTTSLALESGILFAKLLRNLLLKNQSNPITPLPALDSLKEFSTPTSRLYNWNILTEAFHSISFEIKPDHKSLIVAGDRTCVMDFLKEIYTRIVIGAATDKSHQEFDDFEELALDSSNFVGKSFMLTENKKKGLNPEYVDLYKVQMDSPIENTESLLEFFILCVGKHMNLTTKQAAGLFTKGSKYLAHVIIKGLKGQFEGIITYLQEVYSNLDQVLGFLEADLTKTTLSFVLQALKPGLVSKNTEVSQWTLRVFSSLSFEFLKRGLHGPCWEWFTGEPHGFQSFLNCLKRHPDLKGDILGVLLQIGRFNFLEMLTSLLKKTLSDPKDFFYTVSQLLKPISEAKLLKEDLINSGVLEYWLDYASCVSGDEKFTKTDSQIEILGFFTEVWINYSDKIEDKEEKALRIIDLLKKATEGRRECIKIVAITFLFRLLEHFGNTKKTFIPIIYKTLTMILLENHHSLDLREFLIRNFITIFEQFPSIPINALFEPLLKQIQLSEKTTYSLNVVDFTLFSYIARSETLSIKNSIQLLDYLAKVFLNELIFAQAASFPMVTLIVRHKNNETMLQFILKFVKICLAMLYASEKKKKANQSLNPNNNISKNSNIVELEVLNSQKRALIIEILRQICNIVPSEFLYKLQPLVAHTCLQIKGFSHKNHKGLILILNMFGEADSLLEKYEIDYKENLQNKVSEEGNYLDSGFIDKEKSLLTKKTKNLPSLKVTNADPKALRAIEETKNQFQMKITGKITLEAEKQRILDKQKVVLRKQLEYRSIQHGVAVSNQKDIEINLIFNENAIKLKEIEENLPIIDLEREEERDKLLIEDFNRKYHKTFKYLFLKYASTSLDKEKLTIIELVKLLKDHNYDITHDKISSIIKALIGSINKGLDFPLFLNFFMQIAFQVYGKSLSISGSIDKMLGTFKEEERRQGLDIGFYEEKCLNFIYDKEVVNEINRNLKENPFYVLPEGFSKYQEKTISLDYSLPKALEIPLSYNIAYNIVNDLVFSLFSFNLIEPSATFITITLAKPKLNTVETTDSKVFTLKSADSTSKSSEKPLKPLKEKHRVLEITRKRGLSLSMKLLIANSDPRTRFQTEECAYILEDLLDAVIMGKDSINWFNKQENKVKESKKELERILEEEAQEKEKTRKIRHEQIKKELKEKDPDNNRKPFIKAEEKRYLEHIERSKKVWEVRLKENKEKKEQIKLYKKSKSSEREEKEKEEEGKQRDLKKQKEKEFGLFNKKTKEKLKEKFIKVLETREMEEKAFINQEIKEKLKWKAYNENILPLKLKKETQTYNLEQSVNKTIKSLVKAPNFTIFFDKYENIIKILYNHLTNRTFIPLNYYGEVKTISLEGLSFFAKDFNLSPSVFPLKEIILIYKTLTKKKTPVIIKDTISIGLDYNEFLEFLLRIAIKGEKVFNIIGEKIKENMGIVPKEILRVFNENNPLNEDRNEEIIGFTKDFKGEKALLERFKGIRDEYSGVDRTSIITIEGMFYYLDLPLDPKDIGYLQRKLKEIMVSKPIPNKFKKKDLQRKLEDGIRYQSSNVKNRLNNVIKKKESLLNEDRKEKEA